MSTNDPNAFDRGLQDANARIQAPDPNAFGLQGVAVCPPLNTGNTRSLVQHVDVLVPGPPDREQAHFTWLDTNTMAPAHFTNQEMICVQNDVTGIFYNVEHWADYPAGSRWDLVTTPIDLMRTAPVATVRHLAGVQNAASCVGFATWILDYPQGDRPWGATDVLMSRINVFDNDQLFPDPFFGGNRIQLEGEVTAAQETVTTPKRRYITADFSQSGTNVAELADNFLSRIGPINWIVHPPTGNSEGSTTFNIQDRRFGPLGTDVLGVDPDFGQNLGWLNFNTWRGLMENLITLPTVGTVFRMTQL